MEKVCRVCAKRLRRVSYEACDAKYKDNLKQVFDIDVSTDDAQIHSSRFCHLCYNVMKRYEKAKEHGKHFKHQVDVLQKWCDGSNAVARGRPKGKHAHRPKHVSTHTLISHVIKTAPKSYWRSTKQHDEWLEGQIPDDFKCPICLNLSMSQ